MQVRVIVSGYLRKHIESDASAGFIEIQEDATVRDLVTLLELPEEETFIVAVNGELVPFAHRLRPQDQVRIIPPVSGG